jgi:undecaprenyl-diphosphatase
VADRRSVLAVGVLVALAALLAVLADGAREGADLSSAVAAIPAQRGAARTAGLTSLMQLVTMLGAAPVVVAVALAAMGVVWWRRHDLLVVLAIAVMTVGPAGTTFVIKHVVGRPRPPAAIQLGPPETTMSFPSGHTTSAAALAAVLCWLVWRLGSRRRGLLALPFAVLMALGVAVSRVYLGYHWATDVVAGLTVAALWLSGLLLADHVASAYLKDGPAERRLQSARPPLSR